jgi:hypothetical protein
MTFTFEVNEGGKPVSVVHGAAPAYLEVLKREYSPLRHDAGLEKLTGNGVSLNEHLNSTAAKP